MDEMKGNVIEEIYLELQSHFLHQFVTTQNIPTDKDSSQSICPS